jgi:hypothetical protein
MRQEKSLIVKFDLKRDFASQLTGDDPIIIYVAIYSNLNIFVFRALMRL